ncbi:citrate lyase acyl carrier protein, partial [Klebsiella michiganensis]
DITINSEVYKQFGEQITAVVNETLSALNVTQGQIIVEDKGALDCVIRARMQAAILRGTASNEIAWEKL